MVIMNRKVRAIIVDGTEIMTSYTAVEIADRLRTYDDLKEENERFKADEKFFTDCGFTNIEQLSIAYNDYKSKKDKATTLYLKELSEKGKVDDLACKMFNTLEGNIK
jgi:hypothetical protein